MPQQNECLLGTVGACSQGLTDQTRLLLTDLIHELAARDVLVKLQHRDMDALKQQCISLARALGAPRGPRLSSADSGAALEDSVLQESEAEVRTHMGNASLNTKRMRLTLRRLMDDVGLAGEGPADRVDRLEREGDDRLMLSQMVFTVLRDTNRKLKGMAVWGPCGGCAGAWGGLSAYKTVQWPDSVRMYPTSKGPLQSDGTLFTHVPSRRNKEHHLCMRVHHVMLAWALCCPRRCLPQRTLHRCGGSNMHHPVGRRSMDDPARCMAPTAQT